MGVYTSSKRSNIVRAVYTTVWSTSTRNKKYYYYGGKIRRYLDKDDDDWRFDDEEKVLAAVAEAEAKAKAKKPEVNSADPDYHRKWSAKARAIATAEAEAEAEAEAKAEAEGKAKPEEKADKIVGLYTTYNKKTGNKGIVRAVYEGIGDNKGNVGHYIYTANSRRCLQAKDKDNWHLEEKDKVLAAVAKARTVHEKLRQTRWANSKANSEDVS